MLFVLGGVFVLFIIFILLWVIGFILIITDPKDESTRWASSIVFIGGTGGLFVTIDEVFLPYVRNHFYNRFFENFLDISSIFFSFLCHNGLPYSFLMFTVCYSGLFSKKVKKVMGYTLLVPIIFMLFVTPIYPIIKINYPLLTVWVLPYILMGSFLLIYSYSIELNPQFKKKRLLNNLLAVPPMIWILATDYILLCFDIVAWRYNIFIIILLFIGFIFFCMKYDVLGVRLHIQKSRLNSTIRAMTSGSAILNHTIKNEIMKISMCADNMKSLKESQGADTNENVEIISNATDHMLAMVTRIQDQMQDIVLMEETHSLTHIIDHTLSLLRPYLEEKHIKATKSYNCEVDIQLDRTHIQEVLNNIFHNSAEAIKDGGEITVQIYKIKKKVTLAIQDTGAGISRENLKFVLDPFFSTKMRTLNFGLGLSYCYNVMQKSGGSLEIHSIEGVGTTLFLNFSAKKVINAANLPQRGTMYG